MTTKPNQCLEFESLFLDFYQGHLPKEQRDQLEAHLQECVGCREALERQTELFKVLDDGSSAPELSDDFWDGYWDRLQEKESRRTTGFRPRRLLYSAAAILLVILGWVAGRYWFPAPLTDSIPRTAVNNSVYPVVQRHFEALRPILIDYSNQDEPGIMDDTEILRTLLVQNRLLKRMASRSQNAALLELLQDLEIVIIEMLNSNGDASETTSGVGQMIQDNDLLFKMKLYNRNNQDKRQMPI